MLARGVAVVVINFESVAQFAIAEGKDIRRMIRAASAGFTKFWPIPPNICFTTTIAIMLPSAAIHSGIDTGRLNASKRPVTTALKSLIVWWRFITLRLRYSARTALPTQTSVTISTL